MLDAWGPEGYPQISWGLNSHISIFFFAQTRSLLLNRPVNYFNWERQSTRTSSRFILHRPLGTRAEHCDCLNLWFTTADIADQDGWGSYYFGNGSCRLLVDCCRAKHYCCECGCFHIAMRVHSSDHSNHWKTNEPGLPHGTIGVETLVSMQRPMAGLFGRRPVVLDQMAKRIKSTLQHVGIRKDFPLSKMEVCCCALAV